MMADIELALLICVALCVVLAVHACVMHRRLRVLTDNTQRLGEVMGRLAKRQATLTGRNHRQDSELAAVRQRQNLLDRRPTAGHRIESAVRVARQGAANEAVLKDLGLSGAEAQLLLRLHGIQTAPAPAPANREQARPAPPMAAQAKALAARMAAEA